MILKKNGSNKSKKLILNIKEKRIKQKNLTLRIILKMVSIHNINNNYMKNMDVIII
jgi:hypothetical protein